MLKSFILKVRLMIPLIHVWATAEEDRAEFIPAAGYPEPAAHTRMKSVNMHTQTQRQLFRTQTLSCESFDMSSVHLASSGDETRGSNLCLGGRQLRGGAIGLILLTGVRVRHTQERKR